jgi:PKD repeat protein
MSKKSLALLLLLSMVGLRARPAEAQPLAFPDLGTQLAQDHVVPGSALEKLIAANQDFRILRPEEAKDRLGIPPWLRVSWRKAHPELTYSAQDPTGGYPLILHEVHEWMVSHQNLQPGTPERSAAQSRVLSESGEQRISGAQTSPRSESDIRVNFFDTTKIIGASNNISESGMQAMFFSTNGGVSWGQTTLPLITGDAFHGDPTVEWTSDSTAWSTTIGIDSTGNVLKMRAYKSTNNGATWTFDNTFSGSQSAADKPMIWADHSSTSSFKDNLYAIWHNGAPVFMNRRTGPGGAWQTPIQVSGAETTGTGIGADVKTNSAGDVFAFWPDTGSQRIFVVKSTNGGVSYSAFPAPIRIANTFDSFDISIPAMASRRALIYVSAAVNRTATKNNVYVAWMDMTGVTGCNSPANEPGTNAASTCKTRIWFARSTDGGATWSAPVMINNQASKNDQFAQWLTIDETTGKLAIIYYDTVNDPSRLKTDVYYQSSTDDGSTWSAPFRVTTAQTDETVAGADPFGNQYGDYNALSGRAGLFFPSWTDRRSGGNEEIWTAAISDTPNFTISASPSSLSVVRGGSGSSTITTAVSGGFNSSIALSASGVPSGMTVSFSPSSIAAPGSGSSTMTIAVGSTAATGTSTITVTGTGGGITHTTSVVVTIVDLPPTASFTFSCAGRTCSFDGSGSTDDSGITNYAWNFGDGNVSSGSSKTASHTYATNGTFSVTLTVTDNAGQTGNTSRTVTVTDQPPSADFASVCTGLTCTFDGSNSTDDTGITNYAWSFGDGTNTSGPGRTANHTYGASGTFTVTLTVTDTNGQTATTSRTVSVSPQPPATVLTCGNEVRPAATLLLPYFEVDLGPRQE